MHPCPSAMRSTMSADPLPGNAAAEEQLRAGLGAFIARELERALGSEFAALYAPKSGADALALCAFIDQRWLAVFADSALANRKHLVAEMRDALLMKRNVVNAVEALLGAIGARSRAAVVAATVTPPTATMATSLARPVAATPLAPDPMVADAMEVDAGPPAPVPVVLDGANIGWGRGRRKFSMLGAAIALRYFLQRGHAAALVLPEARLRSTSTADEAEVGALQWVTQLVGTQHLVLTPPGDYDDAYIVHVARRAAAIVVSNDRFNDVQYQAQGTSDEQILREWFAKCRVSFTFHADTFIPNPAFDFVGAARIARRLALPPD